MKILGKISETGFRNRILQNPLFIHKINYDRIQKTVTFEFIKASVLFHDWENRDFELRNTV